MVKLLIIKIFTLLIFTYNLKAQNFEGVIEVRLVTPIDTNYFVYFVKNNLIKIEEYSFDKKLNNLVFIDTEKDQATTYYPEMLMYYKNENYKPGNTQSSQAKIIKGKKHKTIAGYECEEWTIKKKNQNFNITYFVSKDEFVFHKKILPVLQKKDKLFAYYQQFSEVTDFIPFYAVETDLKRNVRCTIEILSVDPKELQPAIFIEPEGFTRYEKN